MKYITKILELERFMTISANPSPALIPPVQTLIRSKQRMTNINNTLNVIRDRLDRMEKVTLNIISHFETRKIATSDTGNTSTLPEVFSSIFTKIRTPSVPSSKTSTPMVAHLNPTSQPVTPLNTYLAN